MERISSRLPAIGVLLLATGLLLVTPLLAVGRAQWLAANARVEAAEEVSRSASRLGYLLRLAPAVSAEQLSSSWAAGSAEVTSKLPPEALEILGLDFSTSFDANRKTVDRLIGRLGRSDLEFTIDAIRSEVMGGGNAWFESRAGYDVIIADVVKAVNDELRTLTWAANAAGDPSVARSARVAEAAASIQIAAAGQDLRWVQLAAAPFVRSSLVQVNAFDDGLSVYRERVANLERVLIPGTVVAHEWADYTELPITRDLLDRYQEMADRYAASGVGEKLTDQDRLDQAELELPDLLDRVAILTDVLDTADLVTARLSGVVDVALTEVERSAEAVVSDANTEKNETLALIAGSGLLVGLAAFGLVVLVARPVRRMADAVQQLGQGRLDTRLPERGPKEIRIGAGALNAALASLQTAEAQAVALAEARLDDPILDQPAPGDLGVSLQAAVTRLATSLAEREDFQRRLAHEAAHDGLTNLPNRNAIMKHLESALARSARSSTSVALMFLDIDGFKAVNDVHGHHAGDALLRTIAQRMSASIRQGDLAGRLGGDEFVIVAEPVSGIEEAETLSNRILEDLSRPLTYEGETFRPSISIGIGLANGDLTADELLRDADLAVYRAKSLGKGRVDVCDELLRGEQEARSGIEQAIRSGLDDGEFVLHYQAALDAVTGRVTSVEALLRWNHPEIGFVPPDRFIPVAERSHLILDIDRWVLAQAAVQLSRWADHPTMGSVPIAVNISGRHLGAGTLCDDVISALAGQGVGGDRLILELTETSLLDDLANAARELSQLRGAGVRIALDDFGTGYMSLAHLRALPVDVIKIDRSFIAEIDSNAEHSLVQLIVDTGHLLGVAVTAEGVETQAQADVLVAMGADFLQGYLYSRPVDADTAAALTEGAAPAGAPVAPAAPVPE